MFTTDKAGQLCDLDVTSFYPYLIIQNGICPAHLNKRVFIAVLQEIVNTRVEHKKRYKETGDELEDTYQFGLKKTINSVYGLFNSPTFWLFDPLCTYQTTINGQLALLMLIERLGMCGITVLSGNTDGIMIKYTPHQEDKLQAIVEWWQDATNLRLEKVFYDKYIRLHVNAYVCVKPDGELKTKGLFEQHRNPLKGYKYPIVGIALTNYFVHDIPIIDTIREYNNPEGILELMAAEKTGKQFKVYSQKVVRNIITHSPKTGKAYKRPKIEWEIIDEQEIQHTNRWYVSLGGRRMIKRKYVEAKECYQDNELVAGQTTTIMNKFVEKEKYDIDEKFYVDLIQKEVDKIEQGVSDIMGSLVPSI